MISSNDPADQLMRKVSYVAPAASHEHCLQLLRNFDYENYIINLLQPNISVRKSHAAIRAFNIELARIRQAVSNEDLGRLRIQFFRDALTNLTSTANNPPAAPVVQSLAEAVNRYSLTSQYLHTLLNARERDLSYPRIKTLDELESFTDQTQGSLIRLHLEILSNTPHQQSDKTISTDKSSNTILTKLQSACNNKNINVIESTGKAIGLAIILRGAPMHASSRLSYVPEEIRREVNIKENLLLKGGKEACQAYERIGRRAQFYLKHVEQLWKTIDQEYKPGFWGIHMARIYLNKLETFHWDPFHENLRQFTSQFYPLRLQLALLKTKFLKRL